jgi:acetoacetyl-[acyl-carrier protein] synthase
MAIRFGIRNWTVAAIKAYLGHTLGPASGDQLAVALGIWEYGVIPGIRTIDHVANDVHHSNCNFLMDHLEVGNQALDAIFINSKGFGGNNATAGILSPAITRKMLEKRHGKDALKKHARLNEAVQENTRQYDLDAIAGKTSPIYRFGENVIEGHELQLSNSEIKIPGYGQPINIDLPNPYDDMI